MKNFLFSCFILIALLSCEKDKLSDNIVYSNVQPIETISTIRTFESVPSPLCDKSPIPVDSVATIELDIDNDATFDFIIECMHFVSSTPVGHCDAYEYRIFIRGISENSMIAQKSTSIADQMDAAIEVTGLSNWNNSAGLTLNSNYPGIFPTTFTIENKYIGVKKGVKHGWIHIAPAANNGIQILEFAINLTDNNKIKTGQKE